MTAKQHFTQYWTGWANSPNELRGNETEDELIERSHIEFAKFHVEAALKAASENAKLHWSNKPHPKGWPYFAWNPNGTEEMGDKATHVNRDSILNAYPLDQIK